MYFLFIQLNHVKVNVKVQSTEICVVPHCKKLISEALRHGSHSFYTANTPCLPLPRKRSPDGATTDSIDFIQARDDMN